MCGMTRSGITSSLPITGTLTSPIPTVVYLPLAGGGAAGEVGDPDQREKHVEHYHDDHQKAYHHNEGSSRRAVCRLGVQPRDREQQDDEQERYYHVSEGYEKRTGKEPLGLVVAVEDVLFGYYLPLFYRLSRTVPYLHHPLLLSRTFSAASIRCVTRSVFLR